MPSSVIVWDTVPDLSGFAAANALVRRSNNELRAEMGDKFPKLIFHSIVCIGALVAQRQEEHWSISALGAPIGEQTEKESRGVGGGGLVTDPRIRQRQRQRSTTQSPRDGQWTTPPLSATG
jgi:hypothetical protein